MLKIIVPETELFDNKTNEFITLKPVELQLEHSLVSIAKWESKWHKSFLSRKDKTDEEMRDYIKCMTLTQNVDRSVYKRLTKDNFDAIAEYIEDPMSAVCFNETSEDNGPKRTITSEVIYSWMVALNIPFECQKWHLNRLITFIRVCNIENNKNSGKSKHSSREIASRNSALNAARRKKLNSKG